MAGAASIPEPTGLSESTGRVMFDLIAVLRRPGLEYWTTTLKHANTIFVEVAPLAFFMCLFQAAFLVIQASFAFAQLGVDPGVGGIILSNLGLRELTMLVTAAALGASMGAGFVTELGAMRVAEEIDAIECIGLHSYPYLVSTRVLAAMIASIPIFAGAIACTFIGGFVALFLQVGNANPGSFAQYFLIGFVGKDIIFVLIKGIVATMVVAIVCSSTGYRASGGPVGVGMAVGEALNLVLVLVMVLNLFMSYVMRGGSDSVSI